MSENMFQRFCNWHAGLSKVGKIALWSLTAILSGSVITSASSNQPQPLVQTGQGTSQTTEYVPKLTQKTVEATEELPFSRSQVDDSNLPVGSTETRVAGVKGMKTITYKVSYADGKETKREVVNEVVTTKPVDEVVAIGTKSAYVAPAPTAGSSCDPNYSPCIPYVAGNSLNCPDVRVMVTVIGTDHHKFDADGDGYGCESYN